MFPDGDLEEQCCSVHSTSIISTYNCCWCLGGKQLCSMCDGKWGSAFYSVVLKLTGVSGIAGTWKKIRLV